MCNNATEYQEKWKANYRLSGLGPETKVHAPCPFCAEPEWMVYTIMQMPKAMSEGSFCQACRRGARAIFQSDGNGTINFEIVQTTGPDQPAWFNPKMRRERVSS